MVFACGLVLGSCGDGFGEDEDEDEECDEGPPLIPQTKQSPPEIDCAGRGELVFAPGMLHRIDLTMRDSELAVLESDVAAFQDSECAPQNYVPASFAYDGGEQLDGVGVRVKGNHSLGVAGELGRSWPLKVDFDRFADEQTLDGLKKINLHALVREDEEEEEWEWPSDPIADYVSYSTMRAHGEPTSRVVLAEVFINDQSQGLYSVVEQVDGGFVRCNFPAPFGDLYKPESTLTFEAEDGLEDHGDLNFKWPDASDHAAVLEFLSVLNDGPDAQLEQVLDIDGALTYFALNIGLGNWDYYTDWGHNYYLYEAQPGRFTVIPWDMNMSQTDWTVPCGVGASNEDEETPLSTRLLRDPKHVARYVELLRAFLEGAGSVQAQHQLLDDIEPMVAPWVSSDRLDRMRDNIAARVPGMLAQLDALDVCPHSTDVDY